MKKLVRTFYTRDTLQVARELLGKYLVHRLADGRIVRGRIVDTEAYAGLHDPASHTYSMKKQKTERTQIWYGEGGYAYVYSIYGLYVCLGIITEPQGTPGAVLIRALEPVEGYDFLQNAGKEKAIEQGQREQIASGPSRLCLAMGIDRQCNELDLCGDTLYLEDAGDCFSVQDIAYAARINIDYAGAGALSLWRYYVRSSSSIGKKTYVIWTY